MIQQQAHCTYSYRKKTTPLSQNLISIVHLYISSSGKGMERLTSPVADS